MATEVKVQLELARDMAVVERGMGLGQITGEVLEDGSAVKIRDQERQAPDDCRPYACVYRRGTRVNRGAMEGETG